MTRIEGLEYHSLSEFSGNIRIAGSFENQVLYRMCLDFPGHSDPEIVSGKMMAIGRIYSASPARGISPASYDGESYFYYLAKQLIKSQNFKTNLSRVAESHVFSDQNLRSVLRCHCHLNKLIKRSAQSWLNRCDESGGGDRAAWNVSSFTSKYLHFHRPNAFPLMDRYATLGLRQSLLYITQQHNAPRIAVKDRDYQSFCNAMIDYLPNTSTRTLRGIDKILLEYGKKVEKERNEARDTKKKKQDLSR